MQSTGERFHGLDCLRAVAMFLGIGLHAGLAYTLMRVPFWPVHDADPSPLVDVLLLAVHDFRMQVFFVLAGFFGCLLHQRYGLVGLWKHRALRIGVPFVLCVLLVQPTLQALWLVGDPETFRVMNIDPPPADVAKADLLRDHFATGAFLEHLAPFHLWFLYFLLAFFVAVTPLVLIGSVTADVRIVRAADALAGRVIRSPGAVLLAAAGTVPLLWPMTAWYADTPSGWLPKPHILAYYFAFFLFGWVLYRHREGLSGFTRGWGGMLLAANVLVFPALLYATIIMTEAGRKLADLAFAEKLVLLAGGALYTWLMIAGLIGFFLHVFSRPRGWVRYLADSSYWCYVMSLTPIVALQLLLDPLPWPGLAKLAVVTVVTIAGLLASYELFVRYTLIGVLLHGRRVRAKRAEASAVSTELSVPS
jgi:hypothetical protein